jgi:hypothetical protein
MQHSSKRYAIDGKPFFLRPQGFAGINLPLQERRQNSHLSASCGLAAPWSCGMPQQLACYLLNRGTAM